MMLGEYMDYHIRSADQNEIKKKREKERSIAPPDSEWTAAQRQTTSSSDYEDEDGYDPYNKPVDRRLLEKTAS